KVRQVPLERPAANRVEVDPLRPVGGQQQVPAVRAAVEGPLRHGMRSRFGPQLTERRFEQEPVVMAEPRDCSGIAGNRGSAIEPLVERWERALEAVERGVELLERGAELAIRELPFQRLRVLP